MMAFCVTAARCSLMREESTFPFRSEGLRLLGNFYFVPKNEPLLLTVILRSVMCIRWLRRGKDTWRSVP